MYTKFHYKQKYLSAVFQDAMTLDFTRIQRKKYLSAGFEGTSCFSANENKAYILPGTVVANNTDSMADPHNDKERKPKPQKGGKRGGEALRPLNKE